MTAGALNPDGGAALTSRTLPSGNTQPYIAAPVLDCNSTVLALAGRYPAGNVAMICDAVAAASDNVPPNDT